MPYEQSLALCSHHFLRTLLGTVLLCFLIKQLLSVHLSSQFQSCTGITFFFFCRIINNGLHNISRDPEVSGADFILELTFFFILWRNFFFTYSSSTLFYFLILEFTLIILHIMPQAHGVSAMACSPEMPALQPTQVKYLARPRSLQEKLKTRDKLLCLWEKDWCWCLNEWWRRRFRRNAQSNPLKNFSTVHVLHSISENPHEGVS